MKLRNDSRKHGNSFHELRHGDQLTQNLLVQKNNPSEEEWLVQSGFTRLKRS